MRWIKTICVGISLLFYLSAGSAQTIVNDVSRLNPTLVNEVVQVKTTNDIVDALSRAKNTHMNISISGRKHRQGGHISAKSCIHLDLLHYNKILA